MRYVSDKVISFSIRVKGQENSVRVNFLACSNGGSSFSTDKPLLAEALERSPMYGKVYRRAHECQCEHTKPGRKTSPKKCDTEKRIKLVTGIAGWQDAVEYLVQNCGSDASKLNTPDAILSEAELKGVKFPDLNVK